MQYRRTTFGTNVSNEKSKQKQSIAWTVKVWKLFQDLFKNYSWNNILRSIWIVSFESRRKVPLGFLLVTIVKSGRELSFFESSRQLDALFEWIWPIFMVDFFINIVQWQEFILIFFERMLWFVARLLLKRSDTSPGIDHSGWEWNNFSPILAISWPAT